MAAGDRTKSGKAKDYVYHYSTDKGETAYCGKKAPNVWSDGSSNYGPVTCKKCLQYFVVKTYGGKSKEATPENVTVEFQKEEPGIVRITADMHIETDDQPVEGNIPIK